MIGRADIDDRVRAWGLCEDVVEKDYVLGWVLWSIGADPVLGGTWIFKGGTGLAWSAAMATGRPLSDEAAQAFARSGSACVLR